MNETCPIGTPAVLPVATERVIGPGLPYISSIESTQQGKDRPWKAWKLS